MGVKVTYIGNTTPNIYRGIDFFKWLLGNDVMSVAVGSFRPAELLLRDFRLTKAF
jgi:hypothetical protein